MNNRESIVDAFLALVRAGLWEKDIQLAELGNNDYDEIYRLSEEQSIIGLVAAGFEYARDVRVPQSVALSFAGTVMQLEQRNIAMNSFVEKLYGKLQKNGIYSILVKGQGIAQCYERPLWRASGDVDLLLNGGDYNKTKEIIQSFGQLCIEENSYRKRIEFSIDGFNVELHGSMRGEIGRRIDTIIDNVQNDIFYGGSVRSWINGNTTIFLPSPDNDVIFVFTHILQHFFRGGIGLRQICDWCRLLWTYRENIDLKLLENRLREAGIMTEWRAFAALGVNTLGMPTEAMPLYSDSARYSHKAQRILGVVMDSGNFGYNRDLSYKNRTSFAMRLVISFYYRTYDFIKQAMIFPMDACRAYFGVWKTGIGVISKQVIQ